MAPGRAVRTRLGGRYEVRSLRPDPETRQGIRDGCLGACPNPSPNDHPQMLIQDRCATMSSGRTRQKFRVGATGSSAVGQSLRAALASFKTHLSAPLTLLLSRGEGL